MQPDTVKYAPGTFCWADVATPDIDSTSAFYNQLLGWTTETLSTPNGPYVMWKLQGQNVAAVMPKGPAMPPGPPAIWTSYIAVASVDESVERARALGAQVMFVDDAMDAGRMGVLADPSGAVIALWEGRKHAGADVTGAPGSMCWNELMTHDADAARRFYTELFGWTAQDVPMDRFTYVMFMNQGRPVAGMLPITPDMGPMPSAWLPYFATTNVDVDAVRAKDLGATICVEPQDVPNMGRFIVALDPQGGTFALWTQKP